MGKGTDRKYRRFADVVEGYRITSGRGFDLTSFASNDLPEGLPSKGEADELLATRVARLAKLQELLYADARWSLLIIFQAMDAGGKDSTIKHVMSGINPQGINVTSFKAPGPQDLAHDFMWRVHQAVPARGMIGVFNRSHYEDVLVSCVHESLLDGAHLPEPLRNDPHFWDQRIADIAAFEAYLARQGTRILKFFLNVGRDEQKARFLARLDEPVKRWKFDPADLRERDCWQQYQSAYQAAIAGTATPEAPWFVVPADRKWYTRLVVAEAIVAALEILKLSPPEITAEEQAAMDEARRDLKSA